MTPQDGSFRFPLFVKGDFDGFIGLFIDNLVNLLLITGLCAGMLGMPGEIVFAASFPAWPSPSSWGTLLLVAGAPPAMKEKRLDVTALPYGINTVTLLVFFFLIIMPVYLQNKAALATCAPPTWPGRWASSAVHQRFFEGVGPSWESVSPHYPRAALLSTLSASPSPGSRCTTPSSSGTAAHRLHSHGAHPGGVFLPAKLPFKYRGLYAL